MAIKKLISTSLCCSLLLSASAPVLAAELNSTNTIQPPAYSYDTLNNTNLQSKLMMVEESVFGQPQNGPLLNRLARLETDFYGKPSPDNVPISTRINRLYDTMFDNSTRPSAVTQMNGIEWFLSRHVSIKPLVERISALENLIYGKVMTGSLQTRMNQLAMIAYGNSDAKAPLVAVTIPKDTLIKIRLVTPLSSQTSQVGEVVKYQAAEDVIYNGKLIIAAGALGEGHVVEVKQARNFGRNGQLNVDLQNIQTFDGTVIPTMIGDKAREELRRLGMAAGASLAGMAILGPIGIIGGAFVHGQNVNLPAGTELYIQTKAPEHIYAIQTSLADNLKVNTPPVQEQQQAPEQKAIDLNNDAENANDTEDVVVIDDTDAKDISPKVAAAQDNLNSVSPTSTKKASNNNVYDYEY